MKLTEYLAQEKELPSAFARRIGVSAASVSRYLSAVNVPHPDVMVAIFAATGGAVQPNDFYDLPALKKRRRRRRAS